MIPIEKKDGFISQNYSAMKDLLKAYGLKKKLYLPLFIKMAKAYTNGIYSKK